MGFIKVTADSCDETGKESKNQSERSEFLLNIDQVAAIRNQEIMLKGTHILAAGDRHYTNIRLVNGQNIPIL
jgi:hypothetical protein